MGKKRGFVGLLAVLLCFASWTGFALAAESPGIVGIDILSVNDFHGSLVESGRNPGAAKFGAFLRSEWSKNPHGTIFLSAGDMFQGSPDSNLLYGKTVVEVLNALRLDAMTLGNHEFDWGADVLWKFYDRTGTKVLAADIFTAQATHFADGGSFDQVYTRK